MKKIFNFLKNKIHLSFFIIFFYILFTNTYFNYETSLINGAADGFSYFEISSSSPNISKVAIQPIHAERFFLSIHNWLTK